MEADQHRQLAVACALLQRKATRPGFLVIPYTGLSYCAISTSPKLFFFPLLLTHSSSQPLIHFSASRSSTNSAARTKASQLTDMTADVRSDNVIKSHNGSKRRRVQGAATPSSGSQSVPFPMSSEPLDRCIQL